MDVTATYLSLPKILLFYYKNARQAATTYQLPAEMEDNNGEQIGESTRSAPTRHARRLLPGGFKSFRRHHFNHQAGLPDASPIGKARRRGCVGRCQFRASLRQWRVGAPRRLANRLSRFSRASAVPWRELKETGSEPRGRADLSGRAAHVGDNQVSRLCGKSFWRTSIAINTAERQLVIRISNAPRSDRFMRQACDFRRRRGPTMAANEAMNRFFRLGVAVSNYSDGQLMRMVAATRGKRDVVLAISTTGSRGKFCHARVAAILHIVINHQANCPLPVATFRSACTYPKLRTPQTDQVRMPGGDRSSCGAHGISQSARNPGRMRRIKYALVDRLGDADGPLGD